MMKEFNPTARIAKSEWFKSGLLWRFRCDCLPGSTPRCQSDGFSYVPSTAARCICSDCGVRADRPPEKSA